MSEFKKVEIVLKVALLPASTKYPIDDVKRQLNSMLFKYNEEVEGIPLSFSQLKFPRGKEYGRIIAEQFWLHVDVTTKLLVFKPEIGMTLEGVINKVSQQERCGVRKLSVTNKSNSEILLNSLRFRTITYHF
jgi:hypothetical protein